MEDPQIISLAYLEKMMKRNDKRGYRQYPLLRVMAGVYHG